MKSEPEVRYTSKNSGTPKFREGLKGSIPLIVYGRLLGKGTHLLPFKFVGTRDSRVIGRSMSHLTEAQEQQKEAAQTGTKVSGCQSFLEHEPVTSL